VNRWAGRETCFRGLWCRFDRDKVMALVFPPLGRIDEAASAQIEVLALFACVIDSVLNSETASIAERKRSAWLSDSKGAILDGSEQSTELVNFVRDFGLLRECQFMAMSIIIPGEAVRALVGGGMS